MSLPTKESILSANKRISPFIHHTPALQCSSLNEITGAKIFFKCENFQKSGSFKARGASNASLKLDAKQKVNGLATHSSGNHAQALALVAKALQISAFIVMPRTVPEIKKKGVAGYGGNIFECDPTLTARESTLREVIKETGATEIHPFNNYDVIEGQATCALELINEVPNLDFVLSPVGGGGLLSGSALAMKFFSPSTEVIACEPAGSDDAYRSLKSGKIELAQSDTIADGLLTNLGDKAFDIIRKEIKEIITVTDTEIIQAMRLIWERLKIIVEPSGAVTLAALIKKPKKFLGKRVGLILSGGNADLSIVGKFFGNSK